MKYVKHSDNWMTIVVDIDGILFHVDVIKATDGGKFLASVLLVDEDVNMNVEHIRIDDGLFRAQISPLVK
jgi:hypothetical protein